MVAPLLGDVSSVVNGIFFVSTILLGITVVQGWIYFHNNDDKWTIRSFIIVLITLDIAETCCSTQLIHHYLISHFGDVSILQEYSSVISADFAITGTTFFLVHLYYARRLFIVGRSWWLPGLIVALSIAMMIVGISAVPIQEQSKGSSIAHLAAAKLTLFHVFAVLIDILITIGLTVTFARARTGFKQTRSILQRLLLYTASRGILVTLVQIGHTIMYLVDPTNYMFWVSIHLTLSKLYVISTLATLNSRTSLKARGTMIETLMFAPTKSNTTAAIRDIDIESQHGDNVPEISAPTLD
ncbi:hypothetical protein FPV67DRAFT_990398 [Lyophyllum atratum]|nr:hypothetical protein FPV67DRAFT_990398 [Lyophyllum atratum]